MNLDFLLGYINLVTLGICLCVGFALKYARLFQRLGNQYIPLIMLILGTVVNVMINWPQAGAEEPSAEEPQSEEEQP